MLLELSKESCEGSQINSSPLWPFGCIDFNFICSLIIWPLLESYRSRGVDLTYSNSYWLSSYSNVYGCSR